MMKTILTIIAVVFSALSFHGEARAQKEDSIESIRQHYADINGKAASYRKVKKELSGFSAEGGQLLAYFHGPNVMKMVATFFGETGRAVEEYYFWEGKLIFVLQADHRYDKPLSGKVVKTTENRFYFKDDKLIRWIDENSKQVATDSTEFAEKQSEYLKTSKQLSEGAKSKNQTIEIDQ
jgi:outer membrane lipoprotein-sorting protein